MSTLSPWSAYRLLLLVAKLLIIGVLAWGAYRMADIAYPYLVPPFPTNIDFLQSKQRVLDKALELRIGDTVFLAIPYMWAFYTHITSSVLVLAVGVGQFSRRLMFGYPRVHRLLGKIYVFVLLGAAAPSGLVMAFFGNGGVPAQYGFVLQALAWWFVTFMAYRTIRRGKLREHGEWMLRSYALSFSAISLRAASYLIFWFRDYHGWRYPDHYILLAWLSWLVNLMIAEGLILLGVMNYYFGRHGAQMPK